MQQEITQQYRLLTRSNFDGIISATLLKKAGLINEIRYLHPLEIENANVKVTKEDIVTNLPFTEGAQMVFDYRLRHPQMQLNPYHALYTDAHSVSEVIYHYYGGEAFFGKDAKILVEAANRSKSASFSREEVLEPKGWDQLIFLTDPRSHLGRYKKFHISNYTLMQKLPTLCMDADIDTILNDPDIKERIILCQTSHEAHKRELKRTTKVEDVIAVVDLRHGREIVPGNRFVLYALYPEVELSIHLLPAKAKEMTTIALGKSIFNHQNMQQNRIDLSEIAKIFGGGGNTNAATCQVPANQCDQIVREIMQIVQKEALYA